MARLNCKCGHITRLTGDTPFEYYMVSNIELDSMEIMIENKELDGNDLIDFIIDYAQETSRCEKCNRLYIYDTENDELVMRVYNLEDTLRRTSKVEDQTQENEKE